MKNLYSVPNGESLFPVNLKKERVNYSINKTIVHDFRTYTKDNNMNMSGVMQTLMENFLIQAGARKPKKKLG